MKQQSNRSRNAVPKCLSAFARIAVAISFTAAIPAYSYAQQPPASHSAGEFPPGPGKATLLQTCGKCHSANLVMAKGLTREGWEETIMKMVGLGANASDEDFTEVLDYLTKNFPPRTTSTIAAAVAAAPAGGAQAADSVGSGKAIFEEKCTMCHNAESTDKKIGPGLKGFYQRGTFSSDGSKVTDESLTKFIQNGKGMMPPFKDTLDAAKIKDVIAYIKTL